MTSAEDFRRFCISPQFTHHVLKIEQALIVRVGQDRRVDIMVGTLARMATDINIITIAEGIGAPRQQRRLPLSAFRFYGGGVIISGGRGGSRGK